MSSAHNAVNQPWLAAEFGGHPAGGIGDVWHGSAEHQEPEHPSRFEELLAPKEDRGEAHHGDKDGPEPNHNVVAVVQKLDGVWPVLFRKSVEALHVGRPFSVGKKAEHIGNFEWVIEFALTDVRLSEDRKRRAFLRNKKTFHSGECDGLVPGNQNALNVAGGNQLQDRSDDADSDAETEEGPAIDDVAPGKQVE